MDWRSKAQPQTALGAKSTVGWYFAQTTKSFTSKKPQNLQATIDTLVLSGSGMDLCQEVDEVAWSQSDLTPSLLNVRMRISHLRVGTCRPDHVTGSTRSCCQNSLAFLYAFHGCGSRTSTPPGWSHLLQRRKTCFRPSSPCLAQREKARCRLCSCCVDLLSESTCSY